MLRRAAAYLSQRICREKVLPVREGARRFGDSRDGDVSGFEACSLALLSVAGRPSHRG